MTLSRTRLGALAQVGCAGSFCAVGKVPCGTGISGAEEDSSRGWLSVAPQDSTHEAPPQIVGSSGPVSWRDVRLLPTERPKKGDGAWGRPYVFKDGGPKNGETTEDAAGPGLSARLCRAPLRTAFCSPSCSCLPASRSCRRPRRRILVRISDRKTLRADGLDRPLQSGIAAPGSTVDEPMSVPVVFALIWRRCQLSRQPFGPSITAKYRVCRHPKHTHTRTHSLTTFLPSMRSKGTMLRYSIAIRDTLLRRGRGARGERGGASI